MTRARLQLASFFSVVLLLAFPNPSRAQVLPVPPTCDVAMIAGLRGCPKIGVIQPFATPESIAEFRQYITKLSSGSNSPTNLPDSFWDGLHSMEYWGYQFSSSDLPSEYRLSFTTEYDIEGFFGSMRSSVRAIRHDGCSYFRTNNPTVEIVDRMHLRVQAQISGKVRSCGNWPWPARGEWKTDIGNIGGDATADLLFSAILTSQPDDRYNGRIVSQDPIIKIDAKAEQILGLDTDSLIGQFIGIVGDRTLDLFSFARTPNSQTLEDSLNLLDSDAFRFTTSINLSAAAVSQYSGSMTSKDYNLFLSNLQTLWSNPQKFRIDPDKSGFFNKENSNQFAISHFARIRKQSPIQEVYQDAEREINLIRGFSLPTTRYVVRPTETLWRIARTYYGLGYYHNLISGFNRIPARDRDRLRVGQIVELPPLHKFEILDGVYFIRTGDSLDSLCRKWLPGDMRRCRSETVRQNSGTNFRRLKVLQPINRTVF